MATQHPYHIALPPLRKEGSWLEPDRFRRSPHGAFFSAALCNCQPSPRAATRNLLRIRGQELISACARVTRNALNSVPAVGRALVPAACGGSQYTVCTWASSRSAENLAKVPGSCRAWSPGLCRIVPPGPARNLLACEKVVHVQNPVKTFGDFTVVRNISSEAREEEVFAFLGPNGVGTPDRVWTPFGA
jgi:hypothetical protein